MTEKLQKVLARAGFGSRREIEGWIEQGKVSVNGQVASLGDRVGVQDKIRLNGKPVTSERLQGEIPRVLVYNKPVGEISTRSDPDGRKTVFERLPPLKGARWIAIGRLDINTSGLLLFTTDGELANRMMHPSSNIDREYAVRVMGSVDDDTLNRLKTGVELEDGTACFTDIQLGDQKEDDAVNRWFYCVLMEGKNREVRRLWESQGLKVSRLKRVRYGPVFIPKKLKLGSFDELSTGEVAQLFEEVGLDPSRLRPKRSRQRTSRSRRTQGKPKKKNKK